MRFAFLIAVLLPLSAGCDWLSDHLSDDLDQETEFPSPSAWQIESVDGIPFQIPPDMVIGQIEFAETTLGGLAVCNTFGGEYRAAPDGTMAVQNVYATEMACGEDGLGLEQRLFSAMDAAEHWEVEEGGSLRFWSGDAEVVFTRR